MMEAMIAAGAVITVVGAVSAIIYRVAIGDRQLKRLDNLKAELEKAKESPKK